MILVDASVWVEHFRSGMPVLAERLTEAQVLTHPFVVGELACGNLKDRIKTLADLNTLPSAKPASNDTVLQLIHNRQLWGRGLGWIDGHLLASALLTNCLFWTVDKKLAQVANDAGLQTYTSPKR